MSSVPTFATPPGFLGLSRHDPEARYVVAGIPLDIGTTNRAGSRFGPQAIRHASRMLVDGAHPTRWLDPLTLPLSDIGDFAIALGDIAASLALIEQQAAPLAHLIALGGEHGVTLALLRALRRRRGVPAALVHFDAHVDTWPDNFGQSLGHGSVFYHAINEGLIDPRRTIQIGIRSPVQREVWDWTTSQGVTTLSAQDVHEAGPEAVAQRIRQVVGGQGGDDQGGGDQGIGDRGGSGNRGCYLSFDIDALDPSAAPGTGTPEIGGLASWQAQAILRRLRGLDWLGMDLVEVAPAYDHAEITALAAATVVWEYLALVAD